MINKHYDELFKFWELCNLDDEGNYIGKNLIYCGFPYRVGENIPKGDRILAYKMFRASLINSKAVILN